MTSSSSSNRLKIKQVEQEYLQSEKQHQTAFSRIADSNMNSLVLFFLHFVAISSTSGQRTKYLGGFSENDLCPYSDQPKEFGVCRRISDCQHEFERFKSSKGELRVCSYHEITEHTAICCPQNQTADIKANFGNSTPVHTGTSSVLDYAVCRDRFREHRTSKINVYDLVEAIRDGKREITDEDCAIIDKSLDHFCKNKTIADISFFVLGKLVEEGEWQNMAAIGWTDSKNNVEYNCGGSIVSERFIITAAHCRFSNRKEPDTLRVGDRFLKTEQDDHHAQQLSIEKFIVHPSYKSSESYHDIALIKTGELIKFSKFVAPACVLLDEKFITANPHPHSAGYGQVSAFKSFHLLNLSGF
jgi:hypothetical protein